MLYRDRGREILFKLWVVPQVYVKGFQIPIDSIKSLKVIDTDTKKWDELANYLAMGGQITKVTHTTNLEKQLEMARKLILIIGKEYHLD